MSMEYRLQNMAPLFVVGHELCFLRIERKHDLRKGSALFNKKYNEYQLVARYSDALFLFAAITLIEYEII